MNDSKFRVNEWDVIFVLLYVLFSAKVLISATTIDQSYSDFMKYIYTFCFFCVMGGSALKLSKKELMFFFIIGFFCLLTFVISKSAAIYATLVVIFMAFVAKRIDSKKVSSLCLLGNVVVAVMIIPFLYFSEIQSIFDYRYGFRVTFGFYNPNYAGVVLLYIYISIGWFIGDFVKSSFYKFLLYSIFAPVILLLMEKTISRTFELLLVSYYMMIVFSTFAKNLKLRKISAVAFFVTMLFIIIFQFYTAINFTPALMGDLNGTFAGRLSLSSYLYQGVGLPKMFYGVNIEQYQPIDFFFIELFYSNSIFISLWVIYLCFRRLLQIKLDVVETTIIMCCIITTLTQKVILIPCFAYFVYIIFSNRESDDNYGR